MKTQGLTIASIAAEVAPFSKAGGLADVGRSLPIALHELGHTVIAITPLHSSISPKQYHLTLRIPDLAVKLDAQTVVHAHVWEGSIALGVPVYFIDYPRFFGRVKRIYGYPNDNQRFYFFNVAALRLLKVLKIQPQVIQCHDWHAGLVPWLIKKRYTTTFRNVASVFTIHNLNFQMQKAWWAVSAEQKDRGTSALPTWESPKWEYINFAKRAILYADVLNTVSEQYAEEILTKEFGSDLHPLLKRKQKNLFGIINGIDYDQYNPATDPGLIANYDVHSLERKIENKLFIQRMFHLPEKPQVPLIGIVSRLSEQKGFDLLMDIYEPLMRMNIQLVVMGAGEKRYEQFFRMLAKKYPKKVGAYIEFNQRDATKIYAGSDMFLMPSRFEPCGLGQLISLRYGSIPIVRGVGGLASSIRNFRMRTKKGNGFVFYSYDSRDLLVAIARATEVYKEAQLWKYLMVEAMQESFSWKIPAQKYVQLFQRAIKNHGKV